MKNVYFIINHEGNHKTITNLGCGASELLFYYTALKLSKFFNIKIINRSKPEKIDNIEYLYLPDNLNPNIEKINNSIIIIQRNFFIAIELNKINPSNTYIVWSHDYLENDFTNFGGKYSFNETNDYFKKNNIIIISVSNFHRKNIQKKMKDVDIYTIYNSLFPELYYKTSNIKVNKNQIVFASNWGKGIDKILNICNDYYKINKELKLILIKPSYCEWEPDFTNYPFVECLGSIKDKKKYCEIIQSSLLLLTTSYPETFGCVFAESLHLGVPVIGDNSMEAGFHEIISKDYLCNFNNTNEVIKLIEQIKTNDNHDIFLNDIFYENNVINKWVKIINE